MITSEYGGERKGTTFHHNGDFSGDVVIVRRSDEMLMTLSHSSHTIEVTVPYEHIEAFVLDKLRRELVEKLENANSEELKKLLLER